MSTQTDKLKIKIDNGTTFGKVYTDVASDARYATATDMASAKDDIENLFIKESNDSDAISTLWMDMKTVKNDIANKQDKLTAGTGISISGNVISCTYTFNGYTKSESDAKYATLTGLSNAVSDLEDKISLKQDTLTAGDGITITDNVISASGGSGGCEVIIRSW